MLRVSFYAVQILIIASLWCSGMSAAAEPADVGSVNSVVIPTELKVVKLYGAGGFAELDAYQSGFFVSADGHILTVWSTVLDVDKVVVVSSDGSRSEAELLGMDPNLEIAILATGQKTNHFFDLSEAIEAPVGTRVLALSNLFGIATGNEMSSIQRGVIMASTQLNASRGSFESVYQGLVYVIDAMTNNPGAAGGALINLQGQLVGMLGKELQDANAKTWLNYAIPISVLRPSVNDIIEGNSIKRKPNGRTASDRPHSLDQLGLVMVPNVLSKTPAYVDTVQPDSVAQRAGLHNDDLLLFINSIRIASLADLEDELTYIDRADQFALVVQRGNEIKQIVVAP
ncbi:MAG: serine protease [Planctomycetales bacterium]|nr:serine protease [Planctomycetales bacterium]